MSTYTNWIRSIINPSGPPTFPPTPIERQCQTPNVPANGYLTGDTSPPYRSGRMLQFSCNACHTGSGTMQCTSTGTWNIIGACNPAPPCPDPGYVANAIRNPPFSSWTCGSSVSFTCNSGFQPTGPTTTTCQANQQGFPPIYLISCVAFGCSDPGSVINANRLPGYQVSFNEGESVIYTCNRCYTGSKTVRCLSRTWIGWPVLCSRLVCPLFTARSSNLLYTFSGNSCGTIINFSCS